ncbi:MAG: amidoligase family protein [Woeseia sp.]|nr:amidoligase family protein [Woeseia sp.]NNE59639.1 amidoligase family protein [Woeseia sp.]
MKNHDEELLNWTPVMPPHTETADGEPRRIGVELEMIGPGVDDVSDIVVRQIGGKLDIESRYEHFVRGDDAGDWGIELDYAYLKERGREDEAEDELQGIIEDAAESLLRVGAEAVVPVEVVSPPLPFSRLTDIQQLIVKLRDAGAKGSGAGLTYAFGMQFNPELPGLDAKTVVSYLKAFFCLYDWLMQQSEVDMTRRLSGYSASFPGTYVRKVVDPDYWPDQDSMIDDYLEENPTRNRALDMLPLFLHLDKDRLRDVVDDPRVKPRPTLHYRLPNCEIDRPDWGVHVAWNDWLQVEELADDQDRLQEICAAYIEWFDKPIARIFDNWAEEVTQWMEKSAA